jgi:hypothetical protein
MGRQKQRVEANQEFPLVPTVFENSLPLWFGGFAGVKNME